jgi:hypothetical protein
LILFKSDQKQINSQFLCKFIAEDTVNYFL